MGIELKITNGLLAQNLKIIVTKVMPRSVREQKREAIIDSISYLADLIDALDALDKEDIGTVWGPIMRRAYSVPGSVYLGPGYKNDKTRGSDFIKKKMTNKETKN